jgi:hypothetical protein
VATAARRVEIDLPHRRAGRLLREALDAGRPTMVWADVQQSAEGDPASRHAAGTARVPRIAELEKAGVEAMERALA